MKFGKLLQSRMCADEMGNLGIGEHFLRYKALKKQLKALSGDAGEAAVLSEAGTGAGHDAHADGTSAAQPSGGRTAAMAPAEAQFVDTLCEDLERFNDFFIGKEEDYVIRMEALASQQAQLAGSNERQAALRSAFVDLHGEMVLLLHWSMLNYAAVVKILKKHDKHSDVLLRTPFLANVLKQSLETPQPFYSTEHVTELVRDAEQRIEELRQGEETGLEALLRAGAARAASAATCGEDAAAEKVESLRKSEALLFRRTQAALETWQEMADKASTPSTVIMPSAKRAKTGEHGASVAATAPADMAAAPGTDSQPGEAAAETRLSSRATGAPAREGPEPLNPEAAAAALGNKTVEAQESMA